MVSLIGAYPPGEGQRLEDYRYAPHELKKGWLVSVTQSGRISEGTIVKVPDPHAHISITPAIEITRESPMSRMIVTVDEMLRGSTLIEVPHFSEPAPHNIHEIAAQMQPDVDYVIQH